MLWVQTVPQPVLMGERTGKGLSTDVHKGCSHRWGKEAFVYKILSSCEDRLRNTGCLVQSVPCSQTLIQTPARHGWGYPEQEAGATASRAWAKGIQRF